MSLRTFSKFYYGYKIDSSNNLLDFQEAAGVLLATLNPGSYTLTTIASEVKRALDAAGLLTYTVTANRSTRKLTISSTSNFKLLVATGTHSGQSCFTLIGFTGSDKTGASTYTSGNATGSSFSNQFKMQDYIKPEHWQEAVSATVNEAASGNLEVISFGNRQFVQMNAMYATDYVMPPNSIIRDSRTGIEDLEALMVYLITKAPVEFMPDENDASTFMTLILETTPESNTGTGFKLKEMYDKDLPGFFGTGDLKMRVVNG